MSQTAIGYIAQTASENFVHINMKYHGNPHSTSEILQTTVQMQSALRIPHSSSCPTADPAYHTQGDDESQWEMGKFDPPPYKTPQPMVTKICVCDCVGDIYHHAKFYANRFRGFGSAHA